MEEETKEIPQETIDRAKSMGWIPKEEFKGEESNWRPADEYVERAENLMPIMKSQLGKYEEKFKSQETEISTLRQNLESQKQTTEKLVKMSEKVGEQAYERAKRELTKAQAQAVADGDVEQWQRLEDEKEKLEKPETVKILPTSSTQAQSNPTYDTWHKDNDWYMQDSDMTLYANSLSQQIKQTNPTLPYNQVLEQIGNKVREIFPHKFENPNRSDPSMVDTSESRSTDTKADKKTYSSLPADAKAQCEKLIAQGIITKEQYVKDYYAED